MIGVVIGLFLIALTALIGWTILKLEKFEEKVKARKRVW